MRQPFHESAKLPTREHTKHSRHSCCRFCRAARGVSPIKAALIPFARRRAERAVATSQRPPRRWRTSLPRRSPWGLTSGGARPTRSRSALATRHCTVLGKPWRQHCQRLVVARHLRPGRGAEGADSAPRSRGVVVPAPRVVARVRLLGKMTDQRPTKALEPTNQFGHRYLSTIGEPPRHEAPTTNSTQALPRLKRHRSPSVAPARRARAGRAAWRTDADRVSSSTHALVGRLGRAGGRECQPMGVNSMCSDSRPRRIQEFVYS